MKGWIGKVAVGLFAVLLLVGVGLQWWQDQADRPAAALGVQALDFKIPRLDGQGEVQLSTMKGQIVLVNFWATWCPPCREEMPYLVKLAKEFEGQGVVLVAANNEGGAGSPAMVEAWVDRTLPELLPYVALADSRMMVDYGISGLPTLVFIDREGRIKESFTGSIPERLLRRKIETMLQDG